MTPDQEIELKRRQKSRSMITALLLGLFVVLMFGISMAKMVIAQ
ncbi:MAG: hypothetical protein ABIR87_06885 [Sphingomicrobium sp.]